MKVIDLLNKIANGEEVPKKIQVYQDIFVLDNSNKLYEHETTRTNLLNIYNGNILNYEVEIIEENKKIEKLNKMHFHKKQRQLANKINEIIDKLNERQE